MYDFRDEIIALAEKTMHEFVRFRLQDMGITDSWRIGIKGFVNDQYPDHKPNYEKLYLFLQDHTEEEIEIEQLDITALTALVHFYLKSRGIYEVSPDSTQLFINHVQALRSLRNTFEHYTKELTALDESRIYYDQLYIVESIAGFAVLVMKYKGPSEAWKEIYHRAKGIERKLWGERWLALDTTKSTLNPDDDISTIIFRAEQGDVQAQIMVGKAYYHGERVRQDGESAYIWIHKAAKRGNPEAEFYLGLCFEGARGVEFNYQVAMEWFRKSAEHGFAAAQYRCGIEKWGKIEKTEQEKKEIFDWMQLSAEQEYPEAIWTLGLCYQIGIGCSVDKEKAAALIKKSAEMGYVAAIERMAQEAENNGDLSSALSWWKLAREQGERSAEYHIRTIEKKLAASDSPQ